MDIRKEAIGLRIFTGSFLSEIEKTFGLSTLKAMLNRLGIRPAELVATEILAKYDKTPEEPFSIPSSAYSLFEATLAKLFTTEIIAQENLDDRIIIKIKNVCAFREVIHSREELVYGGTLCEFTIGYFERALKMLTGLKVEYKLVGKETSEEFCVVNIIFYKKKEDPALEPVKELI